MSLELARRAADGDTSPEVVAWIADGLRRHLAGDDLEHAFGLDRASRLRERNQALRDAAALLTADCPWHTAQRLQKAIRRYQSRVAPLIERNPSKALAPIDETLRRAFDTGCRVPTTPANLLPFTR